MLKYKDKRNHRCLYIEQSDPWECLPGQSLQMQNAHWLMRPDQVAGAVGHRPVTGRINSSNVNSSIMLNLQESKRMQHCMYK